MKKITSTVDAAHGGANWQARQENSRDEINKFWSTFGVVNEFGKLNTVLMHRPGEEINEVINPLDVHWLEKINLSKAQKQFDSLIKVYLDHHVTVLELKPDQARPNHFFMRDLFVMTPQGAILSRPAAKVRAGEEIAVYQALARNKIPILGSILGNAIFEGPDLVFLNPNLAFVATGIRSNQAGADQIKSLLNNHGIHCIDIQTTYGCGHLDGVMNIIDKDKVLLFPRRVSYRVYEVLKSMGYQILELPDREEAEHGMAINMVPLSPGKVLMPSGCPKTAAYLKTHGIEVISIDISELMKGGGAMHCMTGIISREF